jgi:hypothetical protein
MPTGNTINPCDVVLSNKGFMKLNGIEIAELRSLEIKMTPEMKEITLLNSATKGKFITSYNGNITFEFNKLYSRFKASMLECAKNLQLFCFSLEATVYKPDEKSEETIYISNCWLEGDMTLFALKADNDFLIEKFTAGFEIESADFTEVIDDGQSDWSSIGYKSIVSNND